MNYKCERGYKKYILFFILLIYACGGSKNSPPPIFQYNVRYYVDMPLLVSEECKITYRNKYGLNYVYVNNSFYSKTHTDFPWHYDFMAHTGDELYLKITNINGYSFLPKMNCTVSAGIQLRGEDYITDICTFKKWDKIEEQYIDGNCKEIKIETIL